MHILNDMECFKDFPIGKCVLRSSKSILNSMRSDFSYQYYFIDFSFEENSDKEPGGYIPKLSRHLSAQNILHKLHARQPITELDSESDFLIDQRAQKSNLWKKLQGDWSFDKLGTTQGF